MVRTLAKALFAFLLVTLVSPARAQEIDVTAPAAEAAPAKPRIIFDSLVGYGGVGFKGGVPRFTGDSDVTETISPRLSGDFIFAYVYDDNLVADLNIGYAWNRLGDDIDRFVISSVPMTVGARYLLRRQARNRPFFGVGGGAYIWTIHTKDLGAGKDPQTFERLRRANLGYYLTGGIERRMSRYVVASADLSYHSILSENTEDFPSGFNGNKSYLLARLGITFFFSLSERLDQGLPE
jgi:outer membrane protein W